jgi:hypothetical protein
MLAFFLMVFTPPMRRPRINAITRLPRGYRLRTGLAVTRPAWMSVLPGAGLAVVTAASRKITRHYAILPRAVVRGLDVSWLPVIALTTGAAAGQGQKLGEARNVHSGDPRSGE